MNGPLAWTPVSLDFIPDDENERKDEDEESVQSNDSSVVVLEEEAYEAYQRHRKRTKLQLDQEIPDDEEYNEWDLPGYEDEEAYAENYADYDFEYEEEEVEEKVQRKKKRPRSNPAKPWSCYLIQFSHPQNAVFYVGASNNVLRRLRQHNREIKGGATYTRRIKELYPQYKWDFVCITHGFKSESQALQFEWVNLSNRTSARWRKKHRSLLRPLRAENGRLLLLRLQEYVQTYHMTKWVHKAPLAATVPLTLEWYRLDMRPHDAQPYLPPHVSEVLNVTYYNSSYTL
jgi:predicted GIY-YIG superfamily endonuclease